MSRGLVGGLLLLGAACSPAPTAAPAAPPAAPTAAAAAAASDPSKWPTKAADIALYKGADRQAMLEAGAKKEGRLTWYATANVEDLKALSEEFTKKYPYLTVDYINVPGTDIIARSIQEFQAGQVKADVLTAGALAQVADAGALMKFYTPSADAGLPKPYVNADSTRAAVTVYAYVFAYNTNLVPAERVPTKYEDLLDPYWKDKIVTEGPFAPTLELGIVQSMGQDKGMAWLKDFAKVSSVQQGSSVNTNAVVAGTKAATFAALAHLPESLAAEKGAPIKTVFFNPTILYPSWAGPTNNAAHPNAAMLFLDWLVGQEGQQYWADSKASYSPRTDVVYKQAYLQNLKKRIEATPTFQLDDGTFAKDLAPLQKTMRQVYGLE